MDNISYLDEISSERNQDPYRQRSGYAGKVYPNGEFSMGRMPRKKITQKERQYDQDYWNQFDFPQRLDSHQLGNWERVPVFWSGIPIETDPPLSSSNLTNSLNSASVARKARGQKGITSLGKKTIRSGAYLLEKKYGKSRLGLLTVTMPSFPGRDDIVCLLCGEWADLVRRFLVEVGREFERETGRKFAYVGCTEIQEKRYEKFGHPAPHLHIVYVACEKRGNWSISADKFRELWKRVIDNKIRSLLGETVEYESKAAINCQAIKKSAEGYIGKYLSKDGKICDRLISDGLGSLIPSAWFHCSLTLKRTIRTLTVDLPSDYKWALIDRVDLVERGVATWLSEVVIDGYWVGYVGKIPSLATTSEKVEFLELAAYV